MNGRDGREDDGGAASPCVIEAGFSKCQSCGRHIPARVVFENGFTYLFKDCPFEQKSFKELLFKGKWSGSRWKRIPFYWYRTAVGENHGLGRDTRVPNRPILSLILGAECSSRCRICRFINWRADRERPVEFDLAEESYRRSPGENGVFLHGGAYGEYFSLRAYLFRLGPWIRNGRIHKRVKIVREELSAKFKSRRIEIYIYVIRRIR
jgi:hypothetical protein